MSSILPNAYGQEEFLCLLCSVIRRLQGVLAVRMQLCVAQSSTLLFNQQGFLTVIMDHQHFHYKLAERRCVALSQCQTILPSMALVR